MTKFRTFSLATRTAKVRENNMGGVVGPLYETFSFPYGWCWCTNVDSENKSRTNTREYRSDNKRNRRGRYLIDHCWERQGRGTVRRKLER